MLKSILGTTEEEEEGKNELVKQGACDYNLFT